MKPTITLTLMILIFNITSCKSTEPLGRAKDTIKLSDRDVTVSSDENNTTILTEGTFWWVNNLSINGDDSINRILDKVDTSKPNFKIKEKEFTIERKDGKELLIHMGKNNSGERRILKIDLQSGNYFDQLVINQKP